MDTRALRRQVYDLIPSDLEQYPLWEYALDEEGVEGQDEATVRPVPHQLVAEDFQIVRATFVTADGTHFIGYVTPNAADDLGYWQPAIVTATGQVIFWHGLLSEGVPEKERRALYKRLGKSTHELFPITYRVDLPWNGVHVEGTIEGFMWMTNFGDHAYVVRR